MLNIFFKKKKEKPIHKDSLDLLKSIYDILNEASPLKKQDTFRIYETYIWVYIEKGRVEKLPLRKVKCIGKNNGLYKWHLDLKEYNQVYDLKFIEFVQNEVFDVYIRLAGKEKFQEEQAIVLAKYQEVFRSLLHTLTECVETYQRFTPKARERTKLILESFIRSVEEQEKEIIKDQFIEEYAMDSMFAQRLSFELEYIDKFINNNHIPEIVTEAHEVWRNLQGEEMVNSRGQRLVSQQKRTSDYISVFEVFRDRTKHL